MTKKEWKAKSDAKYNSITEFIKEYGTKVRSNESESYTELMMDNHRCIEWNNSQYYIPENSSVYSIEDYNILEYLEDNHHV